MLIILGVLILGILLNGLLDNIINRLGISVKILYSLEENNRGVVVIRGKISK